jgi:hypothetical protein
LVAYTGIGIDALKLHLFVTAFDAPVVQLFTADASSPPAGADTTGPGWVAVSLHASSTTESKASGNKQRISSSDLHHIVSGELSAEWVPAESPLRKTIDRLRTRIEV